MSIRKTDAGSHDSQHDTPEQIRAEIAEVRADLGDTVEALAAKTDVKARAKDAADQAKAKVADSVNSGAKAVQAKAGQVAVKVRETHLPEKASRVKSRVQSQVMARPIPFAVAAGAVIVLAAAIVARRRSR
jgi:hypothetical protein